MKKDISTTRNPSRTASGDLIAAGNPEEGKTIIISPTINRNQFFHGVFFIRRVYQKLEEK